VIGGTIVAVIVALALLAPWIAPHPWDTMNVRARLKPPSLVHWFGTDEFGRDVLGRMLVGAQLSLFMGLAAIVVSMALAVGFVYIPPIARITRSVTLGLAGEEFIQAARARGETSA